MLVTTTKERSPNREDIVSQLVEKLPSIKPEGSPLSPPPEILILKLYSFKIHVNIIK
jgi:hypothetical protein